MRMCQNLRVFWHLVLFALDRMDLLVDGEKSHQVSKFTCFLAPFLISIVLRKASEGI